MKIAAPITSTTIALTAMVVIRRTKRRTPLLMGREHAHLSGASKPVA